MKTLVFKASEGHIVKIRFGLLSQSIILPDMNLQDATTLINPAFPNPKTGIWCDLGCGSGLFTNALASLLGTQSKIYAIDKSAQQIRSATRDTEIEFHLLDFVTAPLPYSQLDGIMIANALHYVADKPSFLKKLSQHLKQDGQLLIIEYDLIRGNNWVPYPITFDLLDQTLQGSGFSRPRKIGERDSVYGSQKMYACTANLMG